MTQIHEESPSRLRSDKLLFEDLQGELMIYDPERNRAFCLNQIAAFVWKHADGNTTVAEMAKRMEQDLNQPVNQQVVRFAQDALSKYGLLAPATVPAPAVSGLTRRDVLQRIGVGAMAIPMVTALFVSPAKAHASSVKPSASPGEPKPVAHLGEPKPAAHPGEPKPAAHPGEPKPVAHHGGFWKWLDDLF